MRNLQIVFTQHEIANEKNIEIERPRPVLQTRRTVTPELKFDIEQRLEQFARSKLGFKPDNGIHKPRLIRKSHRLGRVKRRSRHNAPKLCNLFRCSCQCGLRWAGITGNVSAKSNISSGHPLQSIASALLLAQCLHRLNRSRPARRNQRRRKPNQNKRKNHGSIGPSIQRMHFVKKALHQPSRSQSQQ